MKNITAYLNIILVAWLTWTLSPKAYCASSCDFYHTATDGVTVGTVFHDKSGTVWLGTTKGLMRYDDFISGNRSRDVFPKVLNQPIRHISGTSDGRLWIVTVSRRKYVFDPVSHKTEMIDREWLRRIGVEAKGWWEVEMMACGSEHLMISTPEKLYIHDVKNHKTSAVIGLKGLPRYLYADKNHIHVSTDSLMYSFNIHARTFSHTPISGLHRIADFTIDNYGNTWSGGADFSRYDPLSGTWQTLMADLNVSNIEPCLDGVLVGTNNTGVMHYSHDGSLKEIMSHDAFDRKTPLTDHIRSVTIDSKGNLWISYSKGDISLSTPYSKETGLYHIQPLSRRNKKDDIISVATDHEGYLWLGTDGDGLYRTDATSNIQFHSGTSENSNGYRKVVTSVFFDSRGRRWTGYYLNGLTCDDNGTVSEFLPGTSPYSIDEDDKGYIYIGTMGDGLFRIDPDMANAPVNIRLPFGDWVQQVSCGGSPTSLVATSDGLCSIDTRTMAATRITGSKHNPSLFTDTNIQSVIRDSRGLIWILGDDVNNILKIIDSESKTVLSVPGLDGNVFKSIIEDDNKNIWLASDNAIYSIIPIYDPAKKKYHFRRYSYRLKGNSLQKNNYNYRTVAKLKNGNLVFCGSNGYNIINPKLISEIGFNPKPSCLFTALKVNDSFVNPGDSLAGNVILSKDISKTDRIVLDHNRNNIRLNFANRDYSSPLVSGFFYNLNGLDNEWRRIMEDNITLSNLPPGSYRLDIRPSTADDTLADTVASIEIVIKSPWYDTPWAYLIYFILLCMVVFLVIIYVNDRQKQEMRMAQAEREMTRMNQLNEMKLRFFTNISHDFRTPLSLIITPLEAYLSEHRGKDETAYLTPVYKNALRLLNLVNQILDFRKLEMAGMRLTMSYGDILAFVRDICSSFKLFSDDNDIRIAFECDYPSLYTYFDKDKLSKILMNLLSNAFKFTGKGGTVTVSVSSAENDIRIDVADTGKGIPDADKEKIFDRFYQNSYGNNTAMGCGIGLHIVKELTSLHKGTVSVSDNKPHGSVFSVTIPIVKDNVEIEPDETEEGNGPDMKESTLEESAKSTPTVLLVEDNREFIEFTAGMLSGKYSVLKAANGVEAMEILEKESADVIISDVMMDGMDGFELCKTVKSNINTSHVPVILLTAKSLAEDEMKGLEMGADDYMTKPFNISILMQKIKRLLDDNRRHHDRFSKTLDISPSEITITPLDEEFLSNAIKAVEENMADPDFTVEGLSNILGMHRTHLYKKLSGITGKTPIEFIRVIRLKRAMQYLGKSQLYISEIAYKVGFNSPKLFTKYFKEEFNMSPREYVRKTEAEKQRKEDDQNFPINT